MGQIGITIQNSTSTLGHSWIPNSITEYSVYIFKNPRSLHSEYTMNNDALFNRIKRERSNSRDAISPIIATLLLILIAIAAGVVVYAYVLGFVGNSTGNTGNNTSVISVENVCVSHSATGCPGSTGFSVVVRNVGTTTISSTTGVGIYLSDVTQGTVPTLTTETCTAGPVSPGATFTCTGTGSWTNGPTQGDTVTVKIVDPDGGQGSGSTKTI